MAEANIRSCRRSVSLSRGYTYGVVLALVVVIGFLVVVALQLLVRRIDQKRLEHLRRVGKLTAFEKIGLRNPKDSRLPPSD